MQTEKPATTEPAIVASEPVQAPAASEAKTYSRNQAVPPDVREAIKKARANGEPQAAVAERFKVSESSVARFVRDVCRPCKRSRDLNPAQVEDIRVRFAAGVLYGEQGIRKSSFVKALFGDAFTAENLKSLSKEDDATRAIQGKWAVEIAELEAVLNADPETVKSFISRRDDRWIAKFEEHAQDYPRQCVFIGTTNREEILRDSSGDRRYWPITVTKTIDLDYLAEHRDAIWAAARDLALAGEQHWLTAEEEALANNLRTRYQDLDAWHDEITSFCIGKDWVRVEDIWQMLGGERKTLDKKTQARIVNTLKHLKCKPKRATNGYGIQLRGWQVAPVLRDAGPLPDTAQPLPDTARHCSLSATFVSDIENLDTTLPLVHLLLQKSK